MGTLEQLDLKAKKLSDNKKLIATKYSLSNIELNKLLSIISTCLSFGNREHFPFEDRKVINILTNGGFISMNKNSITMNNLSKTIWEEYQKI